jgi:methyl-accepting chemotaxis protein
MQRMESMAEESLDGIRRLTKESLSKIQEVNNRNIETAQRVEEIRQLVESQTESLRDMQKQTDEFTHKENVKVYRNVQAVVVEEGKKQTEELKEAGKGIKPMLGITMAAALVNILLFILQVLGILGI